MMSLTLETIPNLRPDEVHIWHASVGRLIQSAASADLRSVLTVAEECRISQFQNGVARNEYIATRIFVRQLLSHYFPDTPPSAWNFKRNKYGKPRIERQIGGLGLEFNISHSHGVVLCALSVGVPIGVDVELRGRPARWEEIAESLFSPQEVRELHRAESADVHRKFFEHWTLKEAFIKAIGMGFSFPLQEFSVEVLGYDKVGIKFSDKIDEDSSQWRFRLFEAVEGYQCALAAKCGAGREISLVHMGTDSQLFSKAA